MSVVNQLKVPMATQLCLSCQQEPSKMDLFGAFWGTHEQLRFDIYLRHSFASLPPCWIFFFLNFPLVVRWRLG